MNDKPPLGSWGRMYGLVIGSAILLMLCLYWVTATWNIPMEPR